MTSRALPFLLVPLLFTPENPCRATTAASLADRIVIDGRLSDWSADEWVLDASSTLPERPDDSRWAGEEIVRVGVTWDARFLYLAVEFRAATGALFAALRYGPGGLFSLDGAGVFRRAIDLAFAPNVVMIADPRDTPVLARVDDVGVLALVDRAAAPAVVRADGEGGAVLEAALPWSLLALADDLRLVAALTGSLGSGAGDAAPDPSRALPAGAGPRSKTRAVLDRWLSIPADADGDGNADAGVAPRAAVLVSPDASAPAARPPRMDADLRVTPGVFAPDRGEVVDLAVTFASAQALAIFATARVHAIDGALVRVLYENQPRAISGSTLPPAASDRWDGRDDAGRVVPGGIYVVSFEWGLTPGERLGRDTAGVAVAR